MNVWRKGALMAAAVLAMAGPAWAAPFDGVEPGVDTLGKATAAWGAPVTSRPAGPFTHHFFAHPAAPQGKVMATVETASGRLTMIVFQRAGEPRPIAELAAAEGVMEQAIAVDRTPQRELIHLPAIGIAYQVAPGTDKATTTTLYYHPAMAKAMGIVPTAQRLGDYLAVKRQAPAASAGDKPAAYVKCLTTFKALNDDFMGVIQRVAAGELPKDTPAEHDLAGDLFALLQTITGKDAMQEMADDPSCIPDYLAEMREQTDLLKAKQAKVGSTRYAKYVTGLDLALVAAGF